MHAKHLPCTMSLQSLVLIAITQTMFLLECRHAQTDTQTPLIILTMRQLSQFQLPHIRYISLGTGKHKSNFIKQEAFEKCWAHSLLRAAVTLPVTRCR